MSESENKPTLTVVAGREGPIKGPSSNAARTVKAKTTAPRKRGRDDANEVHAEAYRDLEGDVCDLERMGAIAENLIMECSASEDGLRELELATFAVCQLAKMIGEFRESYYKRYNGEKQGASESPAPID
jgi:hypothetical protein